MMRSRLGQSSIEELRARDEDGAVHGWSKFPQPPFLVASRYYSTQYDMTLPGGTGADPR